MADKTFYRYIDANGDAHFVDLPTDVPKEIRGSVEKLTIREHTGATAAVGKAAEAVGIAEGAVHQMHWPSFAWGLGIAAAVFFVMRIFAIGRMLFLGLAALLAAGGIGAGFTLKNLTSHLPASLGNVLPSGTDLKQLPSPAEAKRILDSLPKAGADRDKALESVFSSEKK